MGRIDAILGKLYIFMNFWSTESCSQRCIWGGRVLVYIWYMDVDAYFVPFCFFFSSLMQWDMNPFPFGRWPGLTWWEPREMLGSVTRKRVLEAQGLAGASGTCVWAHCRCWLVFLSPFEQQTEAVKVLRVLRSEWRHEMWNLFVEADFSSSKVKLHSGETQMAFPETTFNLLQMDFRTGRVEWSYLLWDPHSSWYSPNSDSPGVGSKQPGEVCSSIHF